MLKNRKSYLTLVLTSVVVITLIVVLLKLNIPAPTREIEIILPNENFL